MTNNKLRPAMLFGLAVFTLNVLLASCNFGLTPETGEFPQILAQSDLNRKDVLALWHLAEKHETSEGELSAQVQAMLQFDSDATARSASSSVSAISITGVHEFSITMEDGFSTVTANRRPENAPKEKTEIPFYVFSLENQIEQTNGFALTCGDARIGNLLALVENGDFDDTDNPFWSMFNSCLDSYMRETIELYNSIRDEDITVAMAKSKAEEARVLNNGPASPADLFWNKVKDYVAPLTIATQWNQDKTPYWNVINSVAGRTGGDRWVTGCVATAMAQIMAHYGWPEKPPASLRKPSSTLIISSFVDPYTYLNTPFSSINYDWVEMKAKPNANSLPNDSYKTQIGVLMLEIGNNVSMNYGTVVSNASIDDVPSAFEKMGYFKPKIKSYNFEDIKASLDEGKPVFAGGCAKKEYLLGFIPLYKEGHAWVIDGYRTTYMIIMQTAEGPDYIGLTDYVRCNVGWGGDYNGWYLNGVFDMSNGAGPVKEERSVERSEKSNYYQYKLEIIPFITEAKPVSIALISGIIYPCVGGRPVTEITETNEYTGTVTWSPNHTGFVYGTQYTATITLTPKQSYTLQDVPANFFEVAGAASVTNAISSGVVNAEFWCVWYPGHGP